MAKRTHNQNTLLFGSQNGICDECGFQFKQTDLRKKWDGLVVCKDCWEPQHPSDLYDYRSRDNSGGAGSNARPDTETESGGTDIEGNTFPPPINITTLTISNPGYNSSYTTDIETDVAANTLALTFSISAGALPTGLSIATSSSNSSTGIISGTATVNGDYSFTVKATAPDGRTDTQAYSITIGLGAPASWSASSIPIAGQSSTPGTHINNRAWFERTGEMAQVSGGTSGKYVYLLDEVAETWSLGGTTTPTNTFNSQGLVAEYNDELYIYFRGGSTQRYNEQTDTWTNVGSDGYIDNIGFCEWSPTNSIYKFGGNSYSTGLNLDTVRRLDLATDTWNAVSSVMPEKLASLFAIPLPGLGKILVGGGIETSQAGAINRNCWLYDPVGDSWTATDSLPVAYDRGFNGYYSLTNGDGLICGGTIWGSWASTTNTFVYSQATETWSAGTALPVAASTGPVASNAYYVQMLPSGNLILKRYDTFGSVYVSSV